MSTTISSPRPEEPGRDRDRGFLSTRRGKVIATSLVVLLIAIAAFAVSLAALSDNVTAAQINVTGGTLDLEVNNDTDDTGAQWNGEVALETGVFTPGEVRTATIDVENAGNIDFTVAITANGTDVAGCFGYHLRDTTNSANLPGLGSAPTDVGVAPFQGTVPNVALPDQGADFRWEPNDTKTYELSVRMLQSCKANGAVGTLDFSLVANQI